MDIRLIRKFENGRCKPIEEDLILQETDDDYQLDSFTGKKLYLVDVASNTRQEILPGVEKYHIVRIYDAAGDKDHVYFTTAKKTEGSTVMISLIRYSISENTDTVVYSFEDDIVEIETTKTIKLFILDPNYIFVQKETQKESQKPMPIAIINNEYLRNYNGILTIENYLYSVEDEHIIEICDEKISRYGIDKIVTIEGNICAIKVGYSILEDRLHDPKENVDMPAEIIGIINVKQFISDLVLRKEQVYIEVLDEGNPNRTFPYMKLKEGNIVFSRVDIKNHREEVVIYEYNSKVTKVRVNNNLTKLSDLWHTHIINDTPYLLSVTEKSTELINLNIQKPEWKLDSNYKVKFIKNDIIILEKHVKKGLFRKESNYILAYKYPNVHKEIFREKAKFIGCLITEEDNLLIFAN